MINLVPYDMGDDDSHDSTMIRCICHVMFGIVANFDDFTEGSPRTPSLCADEQKSAVNRHIASQTVIT